MRLAPSTSLLRSAGAAGVVCATLALLPQVAWACATCMGDTGRGKFSILLGFIGVPFVIAGGVFVAARQLSKK